MTTMTIMETPNNHDHVPSNSSGILKKSTNTNLVQDIDLLKIFFKYTNIPPYKYTNIPIYLPINQG